jgi:hypothetical protein
VCSLPHDVLLRPIQGVVLFVEIVFILRGYQKWKNWRGE